ncbi:SH3 domain protein [Orbus hercynius]|uniref:SH3 domain protein n=2 Tax=Orbus hercynius TaxID=593135 RepID=A0A495RCS9_9GAMM|nr:SH3 domain protein [Orbus hercynius]
MKKSRYTLAAFFTALPLITFNATALDKYVTENLTVYLTRGPGPQYAIVGTLNAGEKITVLETSSDGQYTRIQNDAGKIAWVKSTNLTDTPSVKEQVDILAQKLSSAQEQATKLEQEKNTLLNEYSNQLDTAKQQIEKLEQSNRQLQTTFDEQQAKITSLSETVDEKRQDLMLTWFTRGGLVAGIGLILGLILPIIMPKRRNKDRWMK